MTETTQTIVLNAARQVTLTAMVQTVGGEFGNIQSRPAVLILPGGGYSMCSDREAECIAYPYLWAGYHAFVLRYSVGEHRTWPNPLEDYEQAMALLEEKAGEWHIMTDKIAVVGFSAGGHLAACAATMARHRPAAAILVYAALAKSIGDMCHPATGAPCPIDAVDGKTCPCFLVAARDDTTVPIEGMLDFEKNLAQYGTQFESHIYPYGGHGFGPGTACVYGSNLCQRIENWQKDSVAWLGDVLGQLDVSGMTKPTCLPHVNGDQEPYLSGFCTLAHLRRQTAAAGLLETPLGDIDRAVQQRFGHNPAAVTLIEGMRLKEVLGMVNYPAQQVDALDTELRKIPNRMVNAPVADSRCVPIQKMVFAKTHPGQKVNDFAPRRAPGRHLRPDGVTLINDLRYGDVYPNSHFDIWTAGSDTTTPRPALVYFHGGGFLFGDKVEGDPLAVDTGRDVDFCAEVAKQGFCVVSANYALAPEYRFPVQLEQVDQLLAHLTAHAAEYGIDPERLLLAGSSAGADLTELYGALLCNPDYAAAVGVHPSIHPEQIRALLIDEAALNNMHFEQNMNAMTGCWLGTDELSGEWNRLLNPVPWIKAYLPSFINTSNQEIWFEDSARELAARLESLGIDHELFYRGPDCDKLEHGYMQRFTENPYAKECFDHMVNFAKRYAL